MIEWERRSDGLLVHQFKPSACRSVAELEARIAEVVDDAIERILERREEWLLENGFEDGDLLEAHLEWLHRDLLQRKRAWVADLLRGWLH